MPRHLHLDFESFSEVELQDVGAYRYAFDPSTEILCAAMALDNEYPAIWYPGIREGITHLYEPYWNALEDPSVLIYAHSAQMEMAMCQALLFKTWGIACPNLSRFRCTASLARRAALPGGLDKLSEILDLKNKKDKKGAALIKKFSVMQKPKKPTKKIPNGLPARRIYPKDDPEAFNEFLAYCQQDVRAEQEIAEKLAYFDEPINNANYSLDARINARGVPVNLDALRHAQKLIDEETENVSQQFRELTGFEVTQGKVLLNWATDRGYPGMNLQADTIDNFLEDEGTYEDGSGLVTALRMKQSMAYASIKKVATMIACAGPHDNRIRGMLGHHGATTGRWTNNLVQFQNMKRPADDMAKYTDETETETWSEKAYRDICNGISLEMLHCLYGTPLEVISSCIRHFVHDIGAFQVEENNFLDADYSAIEARIVCWLAGQEDALEEYRQGIDRYKVMASLIYGITEDEVNQFPQRFIGKQAILLCGFQGGPPKFRQTCEKFQYKDLPLGLEYTAVEAFRAKHKKVKQFWYDVDKCAKRAISSPGEIITLRPSKNSPEVSFSLRTVGDMPFLLIRLPSGRKLAYPRPRIGPSKKIANAQVIWFLGRLGTTNNWGDVETYGGKLVENITQAVAADIMANGAHNAERAGYEIATLIHDQALSYYKPGQTAKEFVELLTELPAWAEGLPIAAEGDLVPFYRKG